MVILRKRTCKNKANSNFNDLPEELLELIFECLWRPRKNMILGATVDFIRISAVCKKWQSAASNANKHSGFVGPLIFIPPARKNGRSSHLRDFSSNIDQQLRVPSTIDRRFVNSWNEWLVTVENRNRVDPGYQIHFYNMFSGAYIQLPKSSTLHDPYYRSTCMIRKAVASCTPLDPNCVVMAITYDKSKLAFCEMGTKIWQILKNMTDWDRYEDVIYFKDSFYVVTKYGNLLVCDLTSVKLKAVRCFDFVAKWRYNYLVEISGDLFQIERKIRSQDGVELFMVYKIDFSKCKWQVVDSFGGDKSIFIGHNMSLCISANDLCIRSDCIYFNDNHHKGGYVLEQKDLWDCIGVFDMKTKLVEPIFPPSPRWLSPLFWIKKV